MTISFAAIGLALAMALAPMAKSNKPKPAADGSWLVEWFAGKPTPPTPPTPVVVRPPGPPPTGPRTAADDFANGVARREGVGLRVRTPPATPNAPRTWYAVADYALVGDFEFSATFNDLTIGIPGRSYTDEGNTELALVEPGRGHTGITAAVSPGAGKCFNVGRHAPDRGGMHWNTVHFPRKSDAGRVCIRRRGSELIFLAADGLDAPLVELVRHPADPRLNPVPRVSVYQSHGKVPVPVDVFWTDFVVQSAGVVRGAEAQVPLTPLPAPASYPVTIRYASGKDVLADFSRGDEGRAIKPEGAAVRVKPPVGPDGKGDAYWFRDSRYQVVGDYEYSALVEIDKLGPPGKAGYGSCAVCLGYETGGPLGSVSFGLGRDRSVRGYTVTRYAPTKQGGTWDTRRIPSAAKRARLVMRRTGSELTLLTQEEGQPAPVELVRFPATAGPIPRLRILVDQGGTPATPVDAAISEVTVKAQRLTDSDDKDLVTASADETASGEGVVLDAAPRSRSRKWLLLGVAAVVAVGGTLAGAALLTARGRRRGKS